MGSIVWNPLLGLTTPEFKLDTNLLCCRAGYAVGSKVGIEWKGTAPFRANGINATRFLVSARDEEGTRLPFVIFRLPVLTVIGRLSVIDVYDIFN